MGQDGHERGSHEGGEAACWRENCGYCHEGANIAGIIAIAVVVLLTRPLRLGR